MVEKVMEQYDYATAGKDLPTRMSWPVADNILFAERSDPYGYWYFSFKRGQIPRVLEGAFTGEAKVINAAEAYIANRK